MIVSIDTEYSELDTKKATLLSISIGLACDELLFKPHQIDEVKQYIDKATMVFMQNGIVDCDMLAKSGLVLDKSKIIDIMLLDHLIDENRGHSLGEMALLHFNDNYKSEFWDKYACFSDAPQDEADEYERKDVRYTFDLGIKFMGILKDKTYLVEHVHRLHWVLCDIEREGIKIDTELLDITDKTMYAEIQELLPKLREDLRDYCELWEINKWTEELEKRVTDKGKLGVVRPVFSFTSDSQVREIIYGSDFLAIQPTKKTKGGSAATDYETLKTLSETFPQIQSIVEFKGKKSVYGTFVKGLKERIVDGKVHPHFSVNGTTTGRLSSSNPNFQNMPQDGVIRNFILPDPGCLIVGADYSSLEVLVEANMTEDPRLLQIALEGADKHNITAEAVGMSRKDAKTLNFLCQYGGGVWKIQDTFKVSESAAQEIYDKYWIAYSGVMDYKKKVFKELADTNEVINRFGRVRHFPVPNSKWMREAQERQAYSFMIQGPGAEMTNWSTYKITEYLKTNGMGRVILNVHDEIVASVKKEVTEECKSAIVNIMELANDIMNFKYRVKAKPYGAFGYWRKA